MFLFPPTAAGACRRRSALLPDASAVAAALRGTNYAAEVARIADQILLHRFPILGVTVETGPAIDWRRDYLNKVSTGTPYFRRVPYLDFSRAGDHKVIWELNRHQHLTLLAQAFLLTGRREYLDEAFRQIESWLDANPFLRGINWASALEVAFRALSWAWLWHMAGEPDAGRPARAFSDRAGSSRPLSGVEPFGLLFAQHAPSGRSCGAACARRAVSGVSPCGALGEGRRPAGGAADGASGARRWQSLRAVRLLSRLRTRFFPAVPVIGEASSGV